MAQDRRQFDPDGQQQLAPEVLQKACEKLQTLLAGDAPINDVKSQVFQSGFLPVNELAAICEQTQGNYVKIYSALLDDGTPFVFLAPINEFGEAVEGGKIVLQFCVPPRVPPCDEVVYDFYLKPQNS